MRYRLMSHQIAVLAAAALLVAACVTPPAEEADSGGKGQQDPSPTDSGGSANEGYGRTVAEGAVFGGAVGGLLGWLVDDEDSALIGAAIGAGAGAIAGVVVAEVQEEYAEREDQLEALLIGIRSSNADARELVREMRQVRDADLVRLARIRQQYEDGEIQEYLLEREIQRVARHREGLVAAARDSRETYTGYTQARSIVTESDPTPLTPQEAEDLQNIDRELSQLQQQIDLMAQITSELSGPAV